jgi:glycosyltransferase involved in cell wall biosynthesis
MDLTAEMIHAAMHAYHQREVDCERWHPPFRTRWAKLPGRRARAVGRNVDRLYNRMVRYPAQLRHGVRSRPAQVYHLVDHSYAHLLHAIPPGRGIVTCHDLDTFRSVLDPVSEPRPRWFRLMTQRILDGLTRAAYIACVSQATHDQIAQLSLVPPNRVVTIPNGIAPEFSAQADPDADRAIEARLGPPSGPELLHVGSTIPRKRIDLLLRIVAALAERWPDVRLVKVGTDFTSAQSDLATELGLAGRIVRLANLSRAELAATYRRSALVLQTSEAEGFGLPVAEAQACGAVVLASDLPVLREVGGNAALYAPVGDISAWVDLAAQALADRAESTPTWTARREAGRAQAARFSWKRHSDELLVLYRAIASATGEPITLR